MTRTTAMAIILLLASNAVWCVAWLSDEDGSDRGSPETAQLERTIADLRSEIDLLHVEGPSLLGSTPAAKTRRESSDEPAGDATTDDGPSTDERKAAAEQAAARAAREAALERARATLRKVMQVEDAGLREEGLAEMARALEGDDAYLVEYTLSSLHSIRELEFDKAAFRYLVLEHMDSENAGIRRSALYALRATGVEEGDMRYAMAAATDPSPIVRCHAARALSAYSGSRLEGETGDAVLQLLADEESMVRKGTLRAIGNTQVTPEVEKKLIEMASGTADRHDAVQFALSTLPEKSRDVVDALFTHLSDEDHKLRSRAHWGLQRGVPKDVQPYVAERYAAHLPKFMTAKAHSEALKLIATYGDESLRPQLMAFARNELVDEDVRKLALKAAEYLANKKPGR